MFVKGTAGLANGDDLIRIKPAEIKSDQDKKTVTITVNQVGDIYAKDKKIGVEHPLYKMVIGTKVLSSEQKNIKRSSILENLNIIGGNEQDGTTTNVNFNKEFPNTSIVLNGNDRLNLRLTADGTCDKKVEINCAGKDNEIYIMGDGQTPAKKGSLVINNYRGNSFYFNGRKVKLDNSKQALEINLEDLYKEQTPETKDRESK